MTVQKSRKRRINLFLEEDLIQTLDAFAELSKQSRTAIIDSLLRPSLPTLNALLETSEKLKNMTDIDRLKAIQRLDLIEQKATQFSTSANKHIKDI